MIESKIIESNGWQKVKERPYQICRNVSKAEFILCFYLSIPYINNQLNNNGDNNDNGNRNKRTFVDSMQQDV